MLSHDTQPHQTAETHFGFPLDLDVPQEQDRDHESGLKWSDEPFGNWDPEEEKANGYFSPHKGSKGLYPFAPSVLLEFLDLVGCEIVLVPSEAVADFNESSQPQPLTIHARVANLSPAMKADAVVGTMVKMRMP
ncbi:MAG: hypothetical protein Q9201_000038 [Fulgogasparrea decipioides]